MVIKNPESLYYPDRGSKALIDFTLACPMEGSRSGNIDIVEKPYWRCNPKLELRRRI
jgi:hypothetical protein